MQNDDGLCFVIPTNRLRNVAETVEEYDEHFWRSGQPDDDLKTVFAFVRTLKPIKHSVDNSVEPTICPVCGYKHGLGEKNHR